MYGGSLAIPCIIRIAALPMSLFSDLRGYIVRKRVWTSRIIFIAIAIQYLVSNWYSFKNPEYFTASYFWGTVLILCGAFIRSWSAGILQKVQRLVQEGPYALARNPLYIGSFLIACGFGLYLGDLWYWLGMLFIFIFIYPVTIGNEETKLKALFPDEWKTYSAKVGMFWPIKIDWSAVKHPWSYSLFLKNKEHKTLFLIGLGLLAKLLQIVLL